MRKICLIGDPPACLGFKSVGLDTFPCESGEQAFESFKTAVKEDYAVIFITENFSDALSAEAAKHALDALPAVIFIPGSSGSNGYGLKRLSGFVEQAVGSDILKD